mgnify:CR=1 FL=1|tara:strand:- start:316 stop:471 length:156 start_codon:yes stop_codon:yes gene_type:complete
MMFFDKKKRIFLKKIIFIIPFLFISKSLLLNIKKDFAKKENKLVWYLKKND